MTIRTFKHSDGMVQRLAVADLLHGGGDVFLSMVGNTDIIFIYSDPPWNPGNEKWWRRHAGVEPPSSYDDLLSAWCETVAVCLPMDIFCEQSSNEKHRAMFTVAVERCPEWKLRMHEQWTVYYGSPGSASCRRPNVLLHFGRTKITTDPSGLSGIAMTRTVFNGLHYPPGTWVGDPCMGKGMTSRLAHEKRWNVIGTELNPKRLDYTIAWLLKHGYRESDER